MTQPPTISTGPPSSPGGHAPPATTMLEVRDLEVLLGDYQVLWGAHLSVAQGEIVALLGPNGSGKSTLMNSISGLLRPRAGRIVFEDRAIAEAIIAMGKTLSLTVVAEGVETPEQQAFLSDRQCDEMQGYYFSTPVAAQDFAELLREYSPKPLH